MGKDQKPETRDQKPESLFCFTLKRLKKNRIAILSLIILISLYLSTIFADFLTPYSYDNEEREFSHCPPTRIHFFDLEKKISFRPFVYGKSIEFDRYHQRIYREDKEKIYPIKFFTKGDSYKFLGVFKFNYHLFSVDPPGRIYLFGADSRGRDIFSRILYGSRVSLSIGLVGVFISFFIGLFLGGISGFYGGRVDNLIMRATEMIMMIPGFYLALALRSAFPPSLSSLQVYFLLILIFSFIGWASLARVIRGLVLSLKERDYVLAAKALGISDLKIIYRHILPHTFSYTIVAICLSIPGYILGESGLSLLGLGIQDPHPSWGNLLSEAMGIINIKLYPWILIPGIFIFITVLSFNLLGDGLRDALDPLMKEQRLRI